MGLKFSTMMNLFFAKKEVRVCCIGLDAAGKTTFVNKLRLGEVVSTIPTIGFNVDTVEYKNLKFTMWDIGGQAKLRALWKHYYVNTDCIIFIVDSCDKTRIAEAADALQGALDDDNLRSASLLVLCNKQDMPNAMPPSEIQERLKLRQMCGSRKYYVQACSATAGTGIFEGLDWLSANIPKKASS